MVIAIDFRAMTVGACVASLLVGAAALSSAKLASPHQRSGSGNRTATSYRSSRQIFWASQITRFYPVPSKGYTGDYPLCASLVTFCAHRKSPSRSVRRTHHSVFAGVTANSVQTAPPLAYFLTFSVITEVVAPRGETLELCFFRERKEESQCQKRNPPTGHRKGSTTPTSWACGRTVAGAAHHRYPGRELYALRHERHRLPGHPGDRRLQALPPQAAVHHVQDGPAHGAAAPSPPTSWARP